MAELLLVPGCPPGLFTKQFVEFAAVVGRNLTSFFGNVTTAGQPDATRSPLPAASRGDLHSVQRRRRLAQARSVPHTYPYLVDKFFYTGASPTTATPAKPVFGDPTGDGWFKMFEFFEVPSQMIGAIGPVAQGNNFDWSRQDIKPGLINLNLIIDEEVFFSVFGKQDSNFNQQLLAFAQLRPSASGGRRSFRRRQRSTRPRRRRPRFRN